MKRKILFIVIICFLFIFLFHSNIGVSYCEDSTQQQIFDELEQNVDNQLSNLDFSDIEKELNQITKDSEYFGNDSFVDRVKKIIDGNLSIDYSSFISYLLTILFDNLLAYIPTICLIVSIAIVCSLVGQMGDVGNKKSVSNIVYFVCFSVIVVIVFKNVMDLVGMTKSTLLSISNQVQGVFPVLLTLISAIGGVVSASVYQPAVALLSSVISQIFIAVLVPIFIFVLVFNVVGNLSSNVKLEKLSNFFTSIFKWIIGVVFTLFIAFLSIQGITAISADGISIKTAKFALKSYVPILGGYLSDGISLIMASSVLIKNGVGVTGLVVLLGTILSPVMKVLIFSLSLKLVAGIVEPLSEKRISNFIYGVSKSLSMLIACIVGMGFMYLISVGLVMCSVNIF